MKRALIILLAVVVCAGLWACGSTPAATTTEPVATTEDVLLQEMIASFGGDDNGDGTISDKDAWYAYFDKMKDTYPLLSEDQIREKVVGSWSVTDKFGDTFVHTFNADGTATNTKDGNVTDCAWLHQEGFLYWSTTSHPIDIEQNTRMEVRQIDENTLIFIENDTGSYSGMTYTMDTPYAVLVRQ